ncbi:ubiquinone biosynthesis protein [Rickettsia endosymbiont of Culicoides newsteadi]|nr:ubiquinone biosynthesis protein [Rickettsia endosymbiont of Culicoides newsteadi]
MNMSILKDAFMTIEEKYHSLKVQFVQTLAKLLVFNEWNDKLLADTETECGFVKGYCHIIFPEGIREIVDFFESWQDQKMLELLSQQETPIKIRDRIDLALKIRIKDGIANPTNITPNSQTSLRGDTLVATKQSRKVIENGLLRRLMPPRNDTNWSQIDANQVSYIAKLVHLRNRSYFAVPSNSIFATKTAFRTCDLIWRYAGDKSIDYNYYTKRGLLLSVYITSILYYIQDESEDNIDTDKYITKSLSNIITISSKCKNMLKLPNPVDIPIIRLFL